MNPRTISTLEAAIRIAEDVTDDTELVLPISLVKLLLAERTRTLQLIAELRAEWEQTREASTYTQAAHNGYLAVTKALDELRKMVEDNGST